MVTKKYTSDYRMELSMDSRGRVRETPVYCGAYYRFEAKPEAVRKSTTVLIVTLLVVIATVFVPLLIKNEYAKQFYAFLPQAFAMIPLYMFGAALYRIFTVKGDVIREHMDKIVVRLRNASIFLLVVSVMSVIGAVVFAISEAPNATDWIMIVLNSLRLVLSIALLTLRKRFDMRMVDTPKASE